MAIRNKKENERSNFFAKQEVWWLSKISTNTEISIKQQ